nr:hypothetical protein CFP56_16775 [Quercus suber]
MLFIPWTLDKGSRPRRTPFQDPGCNIKCELSLYTAGIAVLGKGGISIGSKLTEVGKCNVPDPMNSTESETATGDQDVRKLKAGQKKEVGLVGPHSRILDAISNANFHYVRYTAGIAVLGKGGISIGSKLTEVGKCNVPDPMNSTESETATGDQDVRKLKAGQRPPRSGVRDALLGRRKFSFASLTYWYSHLAMLRSAGDSLPAMTLQVPKLEIISWSIAYKDWSKLVVLRCGLASSDGGNTAALLHAVSEGFAVSYAPGHSVWPPMFDNDLLSHEICVTIFFTDKSVDRIVIMALLRNTAMASLESSKRYRRHLNYGIRAVRYLLCRTIRIARTERPSSLIAAALQHPSSLS